MESKQINTQAETQAEICNSQRRLCYCGENVYLHIRQRANIAHAPPVEGDVVPVDGATVPVVRAAVPTQHPSSEAPVQVRQLLLPVQQLHLLVQQLLLLAQQLHLLVERARCWFSLEYGDTPFRHSNNSRLYEYESGKYEPGNTLVFYTKSISMWGELKDIKPFHKLNYLEKY